MDMSKPNLTLDQLKIEAMRFAELESTHPEPAIYGVTDGKAIGTYLEHKFQEFLEQYYVYPPGNSAKGIDFPGLGVDLKVTSIKQPQSSCPFKSGRQKIFGLGYGLLVFVYDKKDDDVLRAGTLNILHVIFVEAHRTADFQMTRGLRELLANEANEDDLIAFMQDRMLPIDDIEASRIVESLLQAPPEQGYLTMSNALQWRLQYKRVITQAGEIDGIIRLR
jgi:hypothetical protein